MDLFARLTERRPIRLEYVAVLCAGLFLSWIGPFGTHADLGPFAKLVYWTGSVGMNGILLFGFFGKILPNLTISESRDRLVLAGALVLLAFAMLCVVALFEAVFRQPIPLAAIPIVFTNIAGLTIAISAVILLIRSRQQAVDQLKVHAPPRPTSLTPLHQRLPVEIQESPIIALKSEDHYVRVYAVDGETLILGRLTDLMKEAAPTAGAQTHRSWWVADWAVHDVVKEGRQRSLIVESGLRIPISRARYAELSAAGGLLKGTATAAD